MRALLALLLLSADARADSDDIITRPLALDRHQIEARLTLEYSLIAREEGTPLSIAPDFWVGVSDRVTVGVIHSNQSVDRIASRSTFCLRESPQGCDRAYQGSGLDVRYRLTDAPFAVAPRARFLIRDVDPWKPAVTVGTLIRRSFGRFSVASDPYLRFGLANRDKGNRAAFVLPLWLGVQPTCRWLIEFHTGVDGDFAVWHDGWHMPVGLVVTARATQTIDIAVEAGGTQLYGPQTDIKQRHVMISVGYRSD